jgi:hypothetical protein
MSEWIAIEQWQRCLEMTRPGIVFEMRNAEGLSLFTPCVSYVPQQPFDWTSPPTEFRAVIELTPQHSTPIPPPKG